MQWLTALFAFFSFANRGLAIHSVAQSDGELPLQEDLQAAIAAALENVVRVPPPKYSEPPGNQTKDLFVPAMHICDEKKYKEFLKRNPGQEKKTPKQATLEKSLGIVHEVFAQLGMPTILEAGSLLGFIRNCGVIPTDADGDVAVLGHWLQGNRSVANLAEAFKKRNGSLSSVMCPKGPSVTGCELRASFADSSYIDVFVYATEKKCPKAPCSFFNSLWPGGTIGPYFRKCDTANIHFEEAYFLNKTYWIPSPPQKYLKENYGPGWTDVGSGVYKTCHFDKKMKPEPDSFADLTPSPEYVLSLQKTGAALDAQVKAATPFTD